MDEIMRFGLAMKMLKDYGEKHNCSCWLEYRSVGSWSVGSWHARICNYIVYDGGAVRDDPIDAVTSALVFAGMAEANLPENIKNIAVVKKRS